MPKIQNRIKPLALAVCSITGVSLSLPASIAMAQGAQRLEEVTVTAQKREQSIQDVPISVSTFDAQNIENASLSSIAETLDFTPNVRRTSGPSGTSDAFFFFRGIGQTDNNINVDPAVGVYLDEVYLGRLQGASLNTFDAQRLEILRGPQGTLFGRNTMAGAVSMVTKDPTEEFSAQARVTYGENGHFDVYGAASGYLSDSVGARVSLYSRQQDGWTESAINGDEYGEIDEQGGRVKVLFDASDSLRFSFGADYAKDNGTVAGKSLIGFNPAANTVPAGAFNPPPGVLPPGVNIPPFDLVGNSPILVPFPLDMGDDLDPDPYDDTIFTDGDNASETERGGVNLTINWDVGELAVKSITAWRMLEQTTGADLDGGGYHFYNADFGTDQDQWSQELQVTGSAMDDRLNYTGGLYYFNEEVDGYTGICVGVTPEPTTPPGPFPPFWIPDRANTQRDDGRCLQFVSDINLQVESYAAYGQAEYDFTDKLTGIVGFRYTYEEKEQTFLTFSDNTDGVVSWLPPPIAPLPGTVVPGVGPETPPYKFKKDWDEISPRLGLTYIFNDTFTAYATWSNGFKSGGFAGRATPGKAVENYEPETLESYEIGFKSEWLDNRVRWNTAVFYSIYDDVQMLVLDAVIQGNPQFITINGGSSNIWGVETEVWAVPLPGLQISLGAGYLNNEWDKLSEGSVIEKSDELPNAPKYTANASVQYTMPLGDIGELMMRGDYSYTDDVSFQPANNPLDLQDAYSVVNLRFAYITPDGDWNIAVYGKNVTDEEYYFTMSDNRGDLGVATANAAPGTEWGVELNFNY